MSFHPKLICSCKKDTKFPLKQTASMEYLEVPCFQTMGEENRYKVTGIVVSGSSPLQNDRDSSSEILLNYSLGTRTESQCPMPPNVPSQISATSS